MIADVFGARTGVGKAVDKRGRLADVGGSDRYLGEREAASAMPIVRDDIAQSRNGHALPSV